MTHYVPRPGALPVNMQLTEEGRLKHFLTVEGLSAQTLIEILDAAESFTSISGQSVKKVPLLRGKTIFNLFLNPALAP